MEPKLPTAHASLALIAFTPYRLSLTTTARAPAGRASTPATIEAISATCRPRPSTAWRISRNQRVNTTARAAASIDGHGAGVLDQRESAHPYRGRSRRDDAR